MADEELVTSLIIDSSQAVQGAQQFTQATGGIVDSSTEATAATDALGEAIDTSTTKIVASASQIRQQNAALISQSAAAGGSAGALLSLSKTTDSLSLAQAAVARQMAAGILTVQQAESEIAKLAARQTDAAAAAKLLQNGSTSLAQVQAQFPTLFAASSKAADTSTTSWSNNRAAVMELEAAGVHAFDALSSGLSPLRVAATEGARVLEALSIGGIASVSSLVAVVAPIAVVTAGIALLVVHATEANSQVREFNTILAGMGTSSMGSAAGLQSVVRQLEATGSAAADAQKAVEAVVRVQGINPSTSSVSTITNLGRDISASTGDDAATEAGKLATALAAGLPSLTAFAFGLAGPNGLTASEASNARQMAAHGDQAGALNVIISALQRQFAGLYEQSLSPTEKAFDDLYAKWQGLLNALSNTGPIQALVGAFASLLTGISKVIEGFTTLANSKGAATPQQQSDINDALAAQTGAFSLPNPNINQAGQVIPIPPANSAAVSTVAIAPIVTSVLSTFQGGALASNAGLSSLVSAVIQAESRGNAMAVSPTGATGLMQLMPGTAQGLGVTDLFDPQQNVSAGTTYLTQLIQQFGTVAAGLAAYNMGPGAYARAQAAGTPLSSGVQSYVSGITSASGIPGTTTPAQLGLAANTNLVQPNAQLQKNTDAINAQNEAQTRLNAAQAQFGIDQKAATAYADAYNSALAGGKNESDAEAAGLAASTQARTAANIELAKQSTLTDMATAGQVKIAAAYQQSEVAGLRAEASVAAQNEALTTGIDYQTRYQQILDQNAATAIAAGQKQLDAAQITTDANVKLAAAAAQSVSAEQAQSVTNQAVAQTQDALNKALASGNPALIAQAQLLQATTEAQIKQNLAAEQSIQLSNATHGLQDQGAQLQLELSLQGQTTEEISKQLDLLKARQTIENDAPNAAQATKDAYVAQVAAVSDLNTQLKLAQQEQGLVNSTFSNIGSTIDQNLTTQLTNLFDGQKITNWGATFKSTIASIGASLVELALIKPAIGSVLSLLGLSGAATQFGSFSQLLNLVSGAATTPASGTATTPAAGSTSSTGTVLQAGGLLNSLFGSSGNGGAFSGLSSAVSSVTSAVNDFGTSLGFASPSVGGLSGGAMADLGIEGTTGGLFGGATLLGAAGSPCGGFAAGSLIRGLETA